MTKKIGIREVTRNFSILDEYDYVDIEDKKTHEYKGMFISSKYAKEFKKFLDEKKQDKLDRLRQFAGKGEVDKKFDGLSGAKIREKIAKEKYGK
jgi:hypothetical protein